MTQMKNQSVVQKQKLKLGGFEMNKIARYFTVMVYFVTIVSLVPVMLGEQYIIQNDWSLNLNKSIIEVSEPNESTAPTPFGTATLLVFHPIKEYSYKMFWIAFLNSTSLEAGLDMDNVFSSMFGALCCQLGAKDFDSNLTTKAFCLGKERYFVTASNKTSNVVKGYYMPIILQEGTSYPIMTLMAINVTSKQWNGLLTSLSMGRRGIK